MSDWAYAVVLGLIQAITEFLPVSSSAHLILPSLLLDWPDQGLAFDVAIHFGSLLAVVVYMRKELLEMSKIFAQPMNTHLAEHRLVMYLLLATIPVVVAGFAFRQDVALLARNIYVIGCTTFLFALPLWWADRKSGQRKIKDMRWRDALWIGVAQILALVPGVSRSGITINAGLFLGLDRVHATKFAFLLAIPVIGAATCLKAWDLFSARTTIEHWYLILLGTLVAATVSFVTIDLFIRLVQRLGMLPFVIYRLVLGTSLLYFAFSSS